MTWHETPAEARDGLAAQEAQDEQDLAENWRDDAHERIAELRWIAEHRRDLRPGEETELEALEIALEDREELAEHIASGGRPPFYRPKEYDS